MTAIDDLTRLHHMHDAAIEALNFMSRKTREDLDNDRMLTLAVFKDGCIPFLQKYARPQARSLGLLKQSLPTQANVKSA